jgi:hypothetical protein
MEGVRSLAESPAPSGAARPRSRTRQAEARLTLLSGTPEELLGDEVRTPRELQIGGLHITADRGMTRNLSATNRAPSPHYLC